MTTQPTKTLWDMLDLAAKLAVPLILGIATLVLSVQQASLAQQQHDADQRSALDQQRATTLRTCMDDIRDLLLKNDLATSKLGSEVRVVARAEVLSTLRQLNVQQLDDGERKGLLILFLSEAGLITSDSGYENVIINLTFADLSGAHLHDAGLYGANLSGANLSGANLTFAHLHDAGLSDAHLEGDDLSDADLRNVDLYDTHLSDADLSRANLSGARLPGADLSRANLSGADLSRANLSGAGIYPRGARNLTQQQLDQVHSCKGAILPKGLTCHHNQ